MIPHDLLEILRCPHCVAGDTRVPGEDPGRLVLHDGKWLVCQEPACGRKYPIIDEIPHLLIESGTPWINTAVDQLPDPATI